MTFIVAGGLILGGIGIGVASWKAHLEAEIDPPAGYARGESHLAHEIVDDGPAAAGHPSGAAAPGTLQGTVSFEGEGPHVAGLVTAHALDGTGLRVSTYLNGSTFRIDGLAPASYEVVVRAGGLLTRSVEPVVVSSAEETEIFLDIRDPDPEPLPSAYYEAGLTFPSERLRDDFRMQCGYCHQLGSPVTRQARSPEDWEEIIGRMAGMGALLRDETRAILPDVLAEGLTGEPTAGLPAPAAPGPAIAGTMIREWPMGYPGGYIHDIVVTQDGWLYGVDMSFDTLHARDPVNGRTRTWRLPQRGHPRGGYLRAALRPIGTALAHQAPHSIEEDDGGLLWTTNSLGNEIMSFDPASGKTRHFSLPRGTFYPHTHRIHDGTLHFTVALSNHLGRLDLASGELTLRALPTSHWEQRLGRRLMTSALALSARDPASDRHLDYATTRFTGAGSRFMPLPYGLAIHPDGSVWYSKLYDNRIGRFDPDTDRVQEWETPFIGPRRIEIGRDGIVWIPGFGSGVLARFDPRTEAFTIFPLPVPDGTSERPYTLSVAPGTGHVWISSTMHDVLYRFDPEAETFTVFPLPTRGAFTRDFQFTSDGEVCTSYSNLPDTHLPDPDPKIMCLRPPK